MALLIFLMMAVYGSASGQTLMTIKTLETQHQACLDEGKGMLGCTSRFYAQMDSVLNLAYNNLRKKMTQSERDALKGEEREWITKRDAYFVKAVKDEETQSETKKSEWGELEYMIVYDDEANFIKARAIVLIKRLGQ